MPGYQASVGVASPCDAESLWRQLRGEFQFLLLKLPVTRAKSLSEDAADYD